MPFEIPWPHAHRQQVWVFDHIARQHLAAKAQLQRAGDQRADPPGAVAKLVPVAAMMMMRTRSNTTNPEDNAE